MSFDVTILTKKVEGIKKAYDSGDFAEALTGAMYKGQQLLVKRAFDNQKDIEGNDFGVYIGKKSKARLIKSDNRTQNKRNKAIAGLELTSYQRKRALKGRQILKKDLQFMFGLRKSVELRESVIKENEKTVVLEFANDEAAKIARGQENQITNIRNGNKGYTKGNGIKIFRLTDSERSEVNEMGVKLIRQIIG